MSSRRDLRVPFRALCGLALPLCAVAAIAQEAPPAAPAVHLTQPPQQIVPTGAEDAAPARVESFASRSAQTADQTGEVKLREMTSESTEGLETVRRPNGAIGLDLQGRFMSVIVAKPREDGTYELSCHTGDEAVDHAHHAAEILAGRSAKLKQLPPVTVLEPQPVLEEK